MPAMSRGNGAKAVKASKVVKAQKTKKYTPSSRKHHFEGFSQRIAKLRIDPIRRTRRPDDIQDVDTQTSYFGTALEEWRDLNMSANFTKFTKEVAPLTESLPMVLHNEARIIDILLRYIEMRDTHSLEPLLGLLAHFAHDLDVRFEKHFHRTVATVTELAAKIEAADAIEWSFTCLAWLFKYLSRLLVPDLRPLYDLMAGFLGKERQKPFVIRFAAEAMSFLVRKAGAMFEKRKEPLEIILRHMMEDFAKHSENELFAQGLMVLFTESIKGVQHSLHSGGNSVLRCLIGICWEQSRSDASDTSLQILRGSLISIVHHTDPETFKPIFDTILLATDVQAQAEVDLKYTLFANQLLFIIVATRKGSRITNWSAVVERSVRLVNALDKAPAMPEREEVAAVLNTLALVLQTASFDAVLPKVAILDISSKPKWMSYFLPFCYLFADLGQERFQSLLLPHFQRFVLNHWKNNELALCHMLPKMSRQGTIARNDVQCSTAWKAHMATVFAKLAKAPSKSDDMNVLAHCSGLLDVLQNAQDASTSGDSIQKSLLALCKREVKTGSDEASLVQAFALGKGFEYIIRDRNPATPELPTLQNLMLVAPRCKGLLPYWTAMYEILQDQKTETTGSATAGPPKEFTDAMIECLGAPSSDLRLVVLKVLAEACRLTKGEVPELLHVARSIEDTPPTIQSSRFISSQIRRLALGYKDIQADPILGRAIPTYCFGLLHIRLAQAWSDATHALKDMSQFQQADEVISAIASSWLKGGDVENNGTPQTSSEADNKSTRVVSDFECSNLQLIEARFQSAQAECANPEEKLRNQFEHEHGQVALFSANNRAQALRALAALPQLAEKRSRLLVPVLLEWAGDDADLSPASGADDESAQKWNRKDQKSMLDIFAQFQNPKVLYRSADVYQALLSLLSNGDAEIQKSALKAVLAWKTPEVNRYEERLVNILDDSRFREEVSIFLRLDEEEAIRMEDCSLLMPVLLRLLYGKAVARAGTASGVRGQQTRRKAIFGALARFPADVLKHFIDIALGSINSIELLSDGNLRSSAVDNFPVNPRKQLGMLNMVGDMLETLGTELEPFATSLANAILLCLLKASKNQEASNEGDAEEGQSSMTRSIRQSGYNGLVQLFTSCVNVEWAPYARIIIDRLISPRLDRLPIETAQSVSGTLKLFSAWSSIDHMTIYLVEFSPKTMERLADCLGVPSAKNEVKLFIIEQILGRLLDHAKTTKISASAMEIDPMPSSNLVVEKVLEPSAGFFLNRIGGLLKQNPPKELLDTSVSCVSRLAPLIKEPEDMRSFIDVATSLLRQPTKRVQPIAKRDLLQTLCHLVPAANLQSDRQRFEQVYEAICPLFAFFRDRESRDLLCQLLHQLSKDEDDLREVADLCTDLNAFATSRLDEPDFERRSLAFNRINEDKYMSLTARQWRPLVHNMLYYIRDNEELAIRTSASFSLRRFVQAADKENAFKDAEFEDLLASVLLPGLQNGMREPSELVRTEYLAVLAHLIKHFSTWPAVSDMHPLLADNDEEASFFTNILHIQQHRRLRALRRLAVEARAGGLSSNNVSTIFVPQLEHFIFDPAGDEGAHNLTAETIVTLSALLESLNWSTYRTTLKRFIGYIKSKPDLEKTVLRLIGAAIDSLYHASEGAKTTREEVQPTEDGENAVEKTPTGQLQKTLPNVAKLGTEVIEQFLPALTEYLRRKEESTVSLRVPVAVAVVKLLRVMPPDEMTQRLPSVLMDVSHILRSRDQGARDMTRKTLAEISALLGPDYFRFVVKELRSALQRGYQLHVLSYTVHSILVENSGSLNPGDLDSCVSEIAAVIMDDIFGVTGQEKDAEEYISKMKEVKSSKSFDSMELIAKITTLPHLNDLIKPIQTLLMEKLDLRTVKKIDELLRRIGLGASQNTSVKDRDILVFCYEIVRQINTIRAHNTSNRRVDDYKTRKYLIQMQSASRAGNKGATSSYLFKLVRFAFDLMRSVLQRHEELKTPANITGFLPIIGDSLVGGQDEVQLSAVRLLTSIIKVPVPKIEKDAPVYASEAISLIRAAPSTTTELAQAALKLVSAILRERPSVQIRENDIAFVLKRLKPDLEEPDRQGVIFNFLKALLGRKIVITEVYEILDTVAGIMVTNQTRTARDLARGTYFQFIMDYPQGKDRLSKQVGFLVKNLEYRYVEGRQSVLELIHLLLNKTHGDLVQDLSSMLFVPLVMVLVNDDSPDCREMAGVLISKILEKSDDDRRKNYLGLMRTWLEQDEQTLLRRVALQCWAMYLGVGQVGTKDMSFLMKELPRLLPTEDQHIDSDDWELLYYALQAFAKISETSPTIAFSGASTEIWTSVFRSLLFPHAWVKLSAARLVGALFADIGANSAQGPDRLARLPLVSSGGMEVSEYQLRGLCSWSIRVLKYVGVSEQLATQTARNLIFLGRCFGMNGMKWDAAADEDGKQNGEAAVEGEEDEAESEEDETSSTTKKTTHTALSHLFNRLSAVLRREITSLKAPALIPKTASLQVTAALTTNLPTPILNPSLEPILLPLHHLTDPSIPAPTSIDPAFTEAYKTLTNMAQEVMNLLQKKLGPSEYVTVMGKVAKTVRQRREGRRQKRRIEAVAAPERWAQEKKRKYEGKRERRKEKGQEAMGRRRGW